MRLFIYPKDMQVLTGRSLSYCEKLYNQILDSFGKDKKKGLTIKDYCLFHGLSEDDVYKALKLN